MGKHMTSKGMSSRKADNPRDALNFAIAQKMHHRRVRPVNVPGQYELYIGVRPPQGKKSSMQLNSYVGDRIFLRYDDLISQFDVGIADSRAQHENCQLWRLEKAAGYPKGVHSLVVTESSHRVTLDRNFTGSETTSKLSKMSEEPFDLRVDPINEPV
jgi:hypothetical protein